MNPIIIFKMYWILKPIALFVIIKIVDSKTAGTLTVRVPLRQTFKLPCSTKTEGTFHSIVWTTTAYDVAKYSLYTDEGDGRGIIHPNFKKRVRRLTEASLEIKDARVDDAAPYECHILYTVPTDDGRSGLRVKTTSYNVIVISPPIITKIVPESAAAEQYTSLRIVCEATSISPFNITWKISDKALSRNMYSIRGNSSYNDEYYRRYLTFHIRNMTHHLDRKKLTCVAQNIAGKVHKKTKVKMLVSPKIISKAKFEAHINKDVILLCNTSANPPAEITWEFFKSFEPIKLKEGQQNEKYTVLQTENIQTGNNYYSSSQLYIKKIQNEELGMFVCVAKNTVGSDQKEIEVVGYTVPDKPNISYAKCEHDKLTINWTYDHDGGKRVKSITIEYKKNIDNTWNKIQVSKALKQYTISALQPETLYIFRVAIRNEIGESEFSDPYEAETTKKEKPLKMTEKKPTVEGTLNLVMLLAIIGGVVLLITCLVGGLCIYLQGKKIKRKKRAAREKRCKEKEHEGMTLQTERLINHYSAGIEK